jgi:hypothetical protein
VKELHHPLTNAVYGVDPERDGLVRVDDGGKVGWFTHQGVWRAGEVFDVDPEMCNWVGGPQGAPITKAFKSV